MSHSPGDLPVSRAATEHAADCSSTVGNPGVNPEPEYEYDALSERQVPQGPVVRGRARMSDPVAVRLPPISSSVFVKPSKTTTAASDPVYAAAVEHELAQRICSVQLVLWPCVTTPEGVAVSADVIGRFARAGHRLREVVVPDLLVVSASFHSLHSAKRHRRAAVLRTRMSVTCRGDDAVAAALTGKHTEARRPSTRSTPGIRDCRRTHHLRDPGAPIDRRHARHRITEHAHHPQPGTNAHLNTRMVSSSIRGHVASFIDAQTTLPRPNVHSGRARYTDCPAPASAQPYPWRSRHSLEVNRPAVADRRR